VPTSLSASRGVTETVPDVTERREGDVERSLAVPYNVVLWNDPVTLMEVVVRVLKKVFGYDSDKAELLMLTAHHEGKVVVWTGERDRAVRYSVELGANGLQSTVARSA
jgi:ATP-dependent Clp protease adaptor protein ClpS